ncbi:MAG: hypothetical protein OXF98_12740, partial [Rhodospirillaceae bacterium]|nr:hypothetical protein [Rhodospirillaceae bacterium]
AIGELQDVGESVKQFASDDATVVVGTVIDPEMTQEIRVTVVATGLGQARGFGEPPVRVVKPTPEAAPNYADLEPPAVDRYRPTGDEAASVGVQELLDIPAFLRRQAD